MQQEGPQSRAFLRQLGVTLIIPHGAQERGAIRQVLHQHPPNFVVVFRPVVTAFARRERVLEPPKTLLELTQLSNQRPQRALIRRHALAELRGDHFMQSRRVRPQPLDWAIA